MLNHHIERQTHDRKQADRLLKAYGSVAAARGGIGGWLGFYNDERPHQALGYQTPRSVFEAVAACAYVDNAAGVLMDVCTLTTSTQAQQQRIV